MAVLIVCIALFRFLPTPSARRATAELYKLLDEMLFLPTPSARRATPVTGACAGPRSISTHALREEGDAQRERARPAEIYFYPRPPRGGRQQGGKAGEEYYKFLPTPSARRATPAARSRGRSEDISTHALREEGDRHQAGDPGVDGISTHALREEGDRNPEKVRAAYERFLPTPSARRATQTVGPPGIAFGFLPTPSARRATAELVILTRPMAYFYPRPPRGGRRDYVLDPIIAKAFLPTPSARRATHKPIIISAHSQVFLPTPSARRATLRAASCSACQASFLPTPSARRATWLKCG